MRFNKSLVIAAAVLCAGAFAMQIHYLTQLYLEQGDVFPEYSTHRADPMGTRALYESLAALPDLHVRRNESDLKKLKDGQGTTLIFAGTVDSDDPKNIIESIEGFVRSGGRLIITFMPHIGWKEDPQTSEDASTNPSQNKSPDSSTPPEEPKKDDKEKPHRRRPEGELVNIKERWGFGVEQRAWENASENDPGMGEVQRRSEWPALPETLAWRSPAVFCDLAEHWKMVYAREATPRSPKNVAARVWLRAKYYWQRIAHAGVEPPEEKEILPVFVERRWGHGSIVLCTDTYFLSNEAMRQDRQAALLAWLIGPNQRVVFEETHKGMQEPTGIMILARQYRLHSVLLVLLALAALFLWRNTSTLIPRHDTRYEETVASETIGREAGSGLVHLLRRSIPPAQLMTQCVDIWKQDLGAEARTNPQRIASVREIAGLDQTEYSARDLVERYRAVSRLLKERNRKP